MAIASLELHGGVPVGISVGVGVGARRDAGVELIHGMALAVGERTAPGREIPTHEVTIATTKRKPAKRPPM
jgi:hypothetical protein